MPPSPAGQPARFFLCGRWVCRYSDCGCHHGSHPIQRHPAFSALHTTCPISSAHEPHRLSRWCVSVAGQISWA